MMKVSELEKKFHDTGNDNIQTINKLAIAAIMHLVLCNADMRDRIKVLEYEVAKNEAHIDYLKDFIKGKGEI